MSLLLTLKELFTYKGGKFRAIYAMLEDLETRLSAMDGAGEVEQSMIENADTAGNILVANASKVFADVAMSGDATLSSDGALTITAGAVGATELSGVGKNGTGAGYTIALVTAAFGDPATLDDGFVGVYRDSSNSKTYHISVYGDTYYGVEETAVPSGA